MTIYLDDKTASCPHCGARLQVDLEIDYDCNLSLVRSSGRANCEPPGFTVWSDYKSGLPDVTFFDPFFKARQGVDGPFIGWTDGNVLIYGELPFGLPREEDKKPANVEKVCSTPPKEQAETIYPWKARDIVVLMRDGKNSVVCAASRPSIDLASLLYPGCRFYTDKRNLAVIFVETDNLQMIMGTRLENIENHLREIDKQG